MAALSYGGPSPKLTPICAVSCYRNDLMMTMMTMMYRLYDDVRTVDLTTSHVMINDVIAVKWPPLLEGSGVVVVYFVMDSVW